MPCCHTCELMHCCNATRRLAATDEEANSSTYSGCGAAVGFESASLLGHLLGRVENYSDIPRALKLYEQAQRPRARIIRAMSEKMGQVWMLHNGEVQEERDRIFREEASMPLAGFPMALKDPFFAEFLFSYDGAAKAKSLWAGNA
jgi:hypothetical protein